MLEPVKVHHVGLVANPEYVFQKNQRVTLSKPDIFPNGLENEPENEPEK
jgi:hypothetical protein